MVSIWTSLKFCCLVKSSLLPIIYRNFTNPQEDDFQKHFEKRRKRWLPAFSAFPRLFSTVSKTNFTLFAMLMLLSANALNLEKSIKILFGKKLKGNIRKDESKVILSCLYKV